MTRATEVGNRKTQYTHPSLPRVLPVTMPEAVQPGSRVRVLGRRVPHSALALQETLKAGKIQAGPEVLEQIFEALGPHHSYQPRLPEKSDRRTRPCGHPSAQSTACRGRT